MDTDTTASDVSGQPFSGQEAVNPKQKPQEYPLTLSPSLPQFVFKKEKARVTWRTPISEVQNHIKIVVERNGFPNGEVVCDCVDPDLLFKSAPALRKRLEDGRIVLPSAPCLDEGTVESMVYDLVCYAKSGTSIPVPEHIIKNPVRMILMHCVLVFFEMEQEAEEIRDVLWNLFASVNLSHSDTLWIWDTFSGHTPSDPYTAPFADEYVQMMAWRILTLDANFQLDANIRSQIESEKEPKYFTNIIEARLKTHGLGRNPLNTEAPKNPSQPTPTAMDMTDDQGRQPADMPVTPSHSGTCSNESCKPTIIPNMDQQELAITSKVGGQGMKIQPYSQPSLQAGTNHPSSTDEATWDQTRVTTGLNTPNLTPNTTPFSFNGTSVPKSGVVNAVNPIPAAGSHVGPGFGRTDDTNITRSALSGIGAPAQSIPINIFGASNQTRAQSVSGHVSTSQPTNPFGDPDPPNRINAFGESGQTPMESATGLNPAPQLVNQLGTANQGTYQPTTTNSTAPTLLSSVSSANHFHTSMTPLPNSGFSDSHGPNIHSVGGSNPQSFGALGTPTTNSSWIDPAQKPMQQASGVFATTYTPKAKPGPPQSTGLNMSESSSWNAPKMGTFNTPLSSSINSSGAFGMGASSCPGPLASFNTPMGSPMNNVEMSGMGSTPSPVASLNPPLNSSTNYAATFETGASSGSSASFNPNTSQQNVNNFPTPVNTNFGGQSHSASANPFPNAGFDTIISNSDDGNNPFVFQGIRGHNRSGSSMIGAHGRKIKRATGVTKSGASKR